MNEPLQFKPFSASRICPKCKRQDAIPAGDTRLHCPLCRQKNNELQRKYQQRVKEREAELKKLEIAATSATKTSMKRKRGLLTVEYQTANALYKALRTTLREATSTAYHLPTFRGCFSIIADPSVDHINRARAVADELKSVAKYPLANITRDPRQDSTSVHVTADCRCLSLINVAGSSSNIRPSMLNSTTKSVSAGTGVVNPLQMSSHHRNSIPSTSRDVVTKKNGNGAEFVEALEASFERNCGGKVNVSVKSDLSHPLGIPGQKVTVKVVHW